MRAGKPRLLQGPLGWALAALLVSGCGASSSVVRAWEEAEEGGECEAPEADACVVLACDGVEGGCGVFGCEDVDPEAMARGPWAPGVDLAGGGRFRSPPRPAGISRQWRRVGLREGAQPRVVFHFRYRDGFLPAFPRLEGKLVKHHLFPQERELTLWFKRQGIDPHAWTMLIPEHTHLRIHRGARGGPWNQAWRDFRDANDTRVVPRAELMAKAFELAYRFDIVGPVVPYGHALVAPGPQMFAP